MKRTRKQRLTLSKKTVRVLSAGQLGRARGDASTDTTGTGPALTHEPCSSSEYSVDVCGVPVTQVCPPTTV